MSDPSDTADPAAPTPTKSVVERVARAMDGAREGVLLTGAGGAIAYANAALLAQAGLDSRRVVGRDVAALLGRAARFDPVTGLPRDAILAERVRPMLALARRKDRVVALGRLDVRLDDALSIADEEAALGTLATRLERALRDTDLVGRTTDGQFALVLQEVVADESLGRASARLLATMREPVQVGDRELAVNARMGMALFPRDASGWEELAGRAASALARAEAGGVEFVFHEEGLNVRSRERLELEKEFTAAADASELVLHFQPVVATQSGRMVGAEALARGQVLGIEALARWPHRERGLVPPGEFIPLAETTGRILFLDRWAAATAVREASRWWDRGWDGWVSVNLSTRSVRDPEIAGFMADLLDSYSVPPDRLVLEITESAAMRDPEATIDILRSLKDVGVRLAIDDFGTGHSSLVYLKRLPVDYIKLDRTFLTDLGADDRDRWVIEAIVALGHRIGAQIVAEGVERDEDLRWLRDAGCDLAQGYLIGRPAPADELDPDRIS